MGNVTRSCLSRGLLPVALALVGVAASGCRSHGVPGSSGAAGNAAGGATSGGGGVVGGGGAGGIAAACAGASDPRTVVASQRILRLTMNETLNTVRYLFDDTEAAALVSDKIIGDGDDSDERARRFPPLQAYNLGSDELIRVDRVAQHVGDYVLTNFASATGCATASDACASTYLDKLAARAYRRRLASDEQARFRALYSKLRTSQQVNGYEVTFTIQEATGYAVQALLSSPQMLWRWELGDAAVASASPVVPLTDEELATDLAFFLTDRPPDDTLLEAAAAGTLRPNLATHTESLLASRVARDWLRTILETYFFISQVPLAPVDTSKVPTFTASTASDMVLEARKFLDHALWTGNLTDVLVSRTAFLNPNLATNIYDVPVPAGATAIDFVQTTLPADRRAGLLTNAAFLTARVRSDPHALLVPRGLLVASTLLCMPHPGPDMTTSNDTQRIMFPQQTAQEQVAGRAGVPLCASCHDNFDPYGLALDNYDTIGRFRTSDDLGKPVDAHTRLPLALGGDAVANAAELAQVLATKPAFTNCMARTLLQYAMVEQDTFVEVPLPPQQAGCATADVVQRYQAASGKTFGDLVRATVTAPAFALRKTVP